MKKLFTLIFSLFIFSAGSAQEEGMWVPQAENRVPEDFYVYDISAVDENIVWVLLCPQESNGEPCQILKTLDGGDTWTDLDISSLGGSFAVSLFALSATTAWITIADTPAAIRYIYKTTDGGDSWTEQRAITATDPNRVFAPVIHFNNEQRGFYLDVFGNRAGRTVNGGDTWSLSVLWNFGPAWFFGILSSGNWWDVKGDTIWWPTSRYIHRSTTGGLFWTEVPLPDTNHTVSSVKFGNNGLGLAISDVDITNGYAGDYVMNETVVYRSINNGNSWTRLDNLPFPLSVITHIPGTDNGFIGVSGAWHFTDMGQEYASAYTLDGGDTWTVIDRDIPRNSIMFVSPTVGWAGRSEYFDYGPDNPALFKWQGNLSTNTKETLVPDPALRVTPNPFHQQVLLEFDLIDNSLPLTITVNDLFGRTLQTFQFSRLNPGWNQLPLRIDAPAGLLLITLKQGDSVQTVKVVKE